jgi:hypothetical protein
MTLGNVHTPGLICLVLLFWTPSLRATDACELPELMHQQRDAATIQHLEDAWSMAFLRGDAEFMRCLLVPQFTEITLSGQLKFLSDELEMATNNRGKNLKIPEELPRATVLLHDNVAVAYGEVVSTSADGTSKAKRYADSFLWENGRWYVFFSEQAPEVKH